MTRFIDKMVQNFVEGRVGLNHPKIIRMIENRIIRTKRKT